MFTTDATVIEIGMHMMTLMAAEAYAINMSLSKSFRVRYAVPATMLVPMLMTCGGVRTPECCGFGSSFRSSRS